MGKATDAPQRVLIVEDDALLALSIKDILTESGTPDIATCSSAKEALAELKRNDQDVLILDVHLADSDDGWAIAELVQGLGTKAPRIVFSTASPEDIPNNISRLGTVLEKPYAPDDLIAATRIKPKGLLPRIIRSRR